MQYYLPNGKRVRRSTGETDEDKARAVLEKQGELSYIQAVEHFFTSKRNLKPTTLHQYQNSLRVLDPFMGPKLLVDIKPSDIRSFISKRRKEVSDASVRRDLAFLSSVFSHAQETLEGAPDINPVRLVSKKHLKEVKRTRWLTEKEVDRLDRACTQEWHRIVVQLAVRTGMRHGELLQLQLDWIDFELRQINLPETITKGSIPRTVIIPASFVDTLKDFCDRRPQLFGQVQSFNNFFRAACQRAGLSGVRFHDLRHTFASWWVMRGGDLYQLQKLMGHSSVQVTERYAHLGVRSLTDSVDTVFGHSGGEK